MTQILKSSTGIAAFAQPTDLEQQQITEVSKKTFLNHLWRTEDRASRTFFHQISERTRRLEERISSRTKFVHKTTHAEADKSPAKQHNPLSQEWWKAESNTRRQPLMHAMNIDQIADTVLKQLDRRIGSWRERTGRM